MNRAAKWLGAIAAVACLHVGVFLALTGVPAPPTIAAEDVGRVPWGPLLEQGSELWRARDSEPLVTWMPDGSGMVVVGRRYLVEARLHVMAEPGGRAHFLRQLPRHASVASRPGRDHMIVAVDRDGDEQYALYRWDLGAEEPVLLTSVEERAALGAFEPDGNRIAYVSTRRNGRDLDVYVMDVHDPGTDRMVLEVEGMWSVYGWSPVDDELVLSRMTSNLSNELYLFDLESASLRRISPDSEGPVRHGSVRWSQHGRTLYYTSDRGTEFTHLRRLDLATGRETLLSDEIPWDVSSVQLSSDGGMLLLAVNEDGRTRHYATDPEGTRFEPLDFFATGDFSALLHPDEPQMLVNHVDDRGTIRGYTYDLRTHELTRWTGKRAQDGDLPAPRLIRYPTFDEVDGGRRMIPAFVYPGVGEGPRPVVINIHGGPEAQARLRSNGGGAQRDGFTLITPNVRGSTGYGRTYTTLDDWYLREDAVRDIGALLDWIETQPNMDAGRVVVTGGSYGGYMVLASLVHYGSRIRCGIDVVGVSNFVTFLENTADYRRDVRRAEYGDERIPEMRAFLDSISPLSNAERITSRLMVVQGANDPRVPVGESRQIVDAVRANGLDVSYVEGANEGHGFKNPWNALWVGLAQRALTRKCLEGS